MPPKLYLNEVSVLPDGERSAFVELRNSGPDPIPLAGVVLRNERGTVCSLPKNESVPGAQLYLVSLDRQAGGGTRCPPDFLSAKGSVELQSAGGRWDFLDWGDTPAGLALRTRGGRIAEVAPGSSFGRAATPSAAGAPTWVRYSGAQVTPGTPNPVPAVDNFMALPGAIFDRRAVPLTWYTVAGATSYRVQVSAAADLAAPLSDRKVATPDGVVNRMAQATTEPLADGRYFWRVQALMGTGEAPFSAPRSFEVRAAAASAPSGATGAGAGGAPAEPPPASPEEVILPVPWIEQSKDTWLLALEADAEDPERPAVGSPLANAAAVLRPRFNRHGQRLLPHETERSRERKPGSLDVRGLSRPNAPRGT